MRVLWICNMMLPAVAESLGIEATNKEGWVAGLFKELSKSDCEKLELGICFPISDTFHAEKNLTEGELLTGMVEGIPYYGFTADSVNFHLYEERVEGQMKQIIEAFHPDLLHIFGTEYPHALAAAKVWNQPAQTLVGLQGIMSGIANAYMADLPKQIQKRVTFRDWYKKDSIRQQQEKMMLRAEFEIDLLNKTGHVAGRTDYDKKASFAANPDVLYHHMNETMRENFYDGAEWNLENCEPHSIFVSQGNYPLKGLHKVIEALDYVRDDYPDAVVYVAGDPITAHRTLKDRIKISSYGKYLLELTKKTHNKRHVRFLGRLDADQMKDRFLKSHVFVSASANENSSNSVGEAMLLGVPVVASRVGGIPSLMEDEVEGLFYEFADVLELADQICRIFAEEDLARALSEHAKERAKRTHDPAKNRERLLEIYGEIMEASQKMTRKSV